MGAYDWVWELCASLWDTPDEYVGDAIYEIASYAFNGNTDAVETVYPLIIAYAKERDVPWLELFARHVRQQAYLNSGLNLKEMLPEVVATLALTARDEFKDCPQSVCAIQDLSICYAGIDAPGYALERIAAVEDVLGKLDPKIDCSACLMNEKMQALCSLDRFDEALAFHDTWLETARSAGLNWDEEVEGNETRLRDPVIAAIGAGKWEQAAQWLERMQPNIEQGHIWKAIHSAKLYFHVAEPQKALSVFPAFESLAENHASLRRQWLGVAFDLAKASILANDALLLEAALAVATQSKDNGRLRDAFDSYLDGAYFAMWQGNTKAQLECLNQARQMRSQLRISAGADERLSALDAQLN